ncbi:carboxymuconolactone decarboxylase family protein [Amycolatopsis sp. NBC_00348]|uniref:carboxymuconolactone decarboxylase family protein n=1 Tax=unclassified Amycolatopsis TaxID=2618356 RepID=UPI002E11E230|nr:MULTISPECIES: carboxymuconolactone decarboxylase family protein [unclassified Amycolatopsis]WSJ80872.1 carboxymuconolactone decarboxylase family protein [Amycolatopsis sp. NBC_01307]
MSRLPHLTPDDLDPEQRALYDEITGGPRAAGPQRFSLKDDEGRLAGPFNAMLVAPPAGQALQALGAAIRYETTLSDRVRELAILAVAARWASAFEQHAHEPHALAAGLTGAQVEAVRAGAIPDLADETERAALRFVSALLREEDVDDVTYAEVVPIIGNRMAVELTTLVGYYATLALQLRVFRVADPAGSGLR